MGELTPHNGKTSSKIIANTDRIKAILIGVAAYEELPKLEGPSVDLDCMENILLNDPKISLYKKGQVIIIENPSAERFRKDILEYLNSLSAKGDILIFYYSGHGCILKGNIFGFLPIDAKPNTQENGIIPLCAISIEEILNSLSNPPAEYPAACCGDESGLFPLPGEGKLKMGWGKSIPGKKTLTESIFSHPTGITIPEARREPCGFDTARLAARQFIDV